MTILFIEIAVIGIFCGMALISIGHYVLKIHTLVQEILTRVEKLEVESELRRSRAALEHTINGVRPWSVPFGAVSEKLRN